MYRAITLYFLRNHIDWTNEPEVDEAQLQCELEGYVRELNSRD